MIVRHGSFQGFGNGFPLFPFLLQKSAGSLGLQPSTASLPSRGTHESIPRTQENLGFLRSCLSFLGADLSIQVGT